ncbi:uncharacterized protein LOC127716625 isoform X1 [Mytilus californianus]|uniref:uncharacterized protein LOC127716625 isoform X1 n=1 Tax=Mytilus californianus TaxID=6549 RepID=UPI002246F08F|nr:uncharacterized protein LOC127716625 isoform X1 [Mytilus californianus]
MFLCKGLLISLLHFVVAAQDKKDYTCSISLNGNVFDLKTLMNMVSTMQGQLKGIEADVKGRQGTLINRGYIGCFRDRNSMLRSRIIKHISQLTLEKCRELCRGYTFLGLQYSNECFCGNTIDSANHRPAPERECNMKCSGENRMCGAGDRNSVYRVRNIE